MAKKQRLSAERLFTKLFKLSKSLSNSDDNLQNTQQTISDPVSNGLHTRPTQTLEILILGCGASGKSTLVKQFEKIYDDVDEKDLSYSLTEIRKHLLIDINDLCRHNIKLNAQPKSIIDTNLFYYKSNRDRLRRIDAKTKHLINGYIRLTQKQLLIYQIIPEDINEYVMIYYYSLFYEFNNYELKLICDKMSKLDPMNLPKLNKKIAKEIKLLWNDQAMKSTFIAQQTRDAMDNITYFMDNIKQIVSNDYIPSFDDYLRIRDSTTGIIHKSFYHKSSKFDGWQVIIVDVGGVRAERRKWLKVADSAAVIFYLMSLSSYNCVLWEDNSTNCLDETLDLFSTLSHHQYFRDKQEWIVLFNKNDIFEKKILNIPFTVYKPDFNDKDKHNPEKVKEYIKNEFIKRFYQNLSDDGKKKRGNLRFHVVSSVNTDEMKRVLYDIVEDLITLQLKRAAWL